MAPTTAQRIVATAACAPWISRRMYPTSSKSGATQSASSSFRFRRAIGPSEEGGPSKTFAQRPPATIGGMRARNASISSENCRIVTSIAPTRRPPTKPAIPPVTTRAGHVDSYV